MIVHLPGLGNREGDSCHSQPVNTGMLVGCHHFLETDLIFYEQLVWTVPLYQMHISGLLSDSYALLCTRSGRPSHPRGPSPASASSPPAVTAAIWEELGNPVAVESAPTTSLSPVLLIETCLLKSYPNVFFSETQSFSPHPAISFCICFVLLDDKIWLLGTLIIAASKWQASGKMIITYSKAFIKLTYPE